MAGDYMKPFLSYYDPKAMEPPLNKKAVDKLEAKVDVADSIDNVNSLSSLQLFK